LDLSLNGQNWFGNYAFTFDGEMHLHRDVPEHIQKDQEEFLKALADHNDGKVRHLTEELQWLLDHKKQFPNDSHDPTPLELFCEQNPDEPECLVYDD
jgi:hypothetical protein